MAAQKTVQLNLILYAVSAVSMYIVVGLSMLIPEWIGAHKSPFACDDYSIRNPFKKQTFSTTVVIIITVLSSLQIIIITEFIIDRHSGSDRVFKCRRFRLPALLVHIVAFEGYFQLGYVMLIVVGQVTKYAVGRLRPHFLTVCEPAPFNCTGGQLIYDYTCTGDATDVAEARLSFYSGHSSLSMYTATFLAIYLHARIGQICPRIVLSTLQTLLFSGGLFICYTRLHDYYHHPSDIATGALIGILGGIYSCWAWADIWRQESIYSPVHGKMVEDDENESHPSAVKAVPVTIKEEAPGPPPDQVSISQQAVGQTERL